MVAVLSPKSRSKITIGLGMTEEKETETPKAEGEKPVVQMDKVKEIVGETIEQLVVNLEERRKLLRSMGDDIKMDVVIDMAKRIRAVKQEFDV